METKDRERLTILEGRVDKLEKLLQETEKPMSVLEAATYLNMTPATLRDHWRKGRIVGHKPKQGKNLLFFIRDLNDFLMGG